MDQNALNEWWHLTQELPTKIAREKELRQQIFNDIFTNPTLGTNRHALGHGKELIAVHKMSLGIVKDSVTPAFVKSVPKDLLARIIKQKLEVSEGGWNKATDDEKRFFGEVITVKPALPSMSIGNPSQRG